jgi:hypothetical protein
MTMTGGAPSTGAGVPPQPSPVATGATVANPAPAPPLPRAAGTRYIGVQRSPSCGRWIAYVPEPNQQGGGGVRVVGAFPNEHAAALAHDRAAIFLHGDRAIVNFGAAFHAIERVFLNRCRARGADGGMNVCAMVVDGTYEGRYAAFLRAVFALEDYGDFWDVAFEFYVSRASEIGEEALVAGGEMLEAKFVAMHRNKAGSPEWRAWHARKIAEHNAERQRRKQQQFVGQKATNSSSSSTVLSRA